MTKIDLDYLQQWVGRKEVLKDVIARTQAAALAATLDEECLPEVNDPLPPLWHWIYFTPLARQSQIGLDGHPKLGGFLPPIPLPRRMWAGGRLRFLGQIRIGDVVERETEILKISFKNGSQGPLIFVTLRHRLSNQDGVVIEEEQDLVYRAASETPGVAQPAAAPMVDPATSIDRAPADWRKEMCADPVMLFRYSALTFNAHRIHYDAKYAVEQEAYPALVVHGPLSATLLGLHLSRHVGGRLAYFEFRGQRPLFANSPFNICGAADAADGEYKIWTETEAGQPAMVGRAIVDPL